MKLHRLLSLFLLLLLLGGPDFAVTFAADNAETPEKTDDAPVVQPDQDKPPVVRRSNKRPKHRTNLAHSSQNERVEMGKDVVIGVGETVSELVVIAGNATVNGTVEGSLVVVSGSAHVNGQVQKDLVTILGSATLGPEAKIGHDVVVVGGPLRISPQADIGGQQTFVALDNVLPGFVGLQHWLAKGVFLARPFPPQVRWVWMVAFLFLLLYLALVVLFPRPVRACVHSLDEQPVAAFCVGLLLFVLLGPLLFLLVVSVAGVLVIPFVICALIVAALFGKVAVYSYAGQQVGRQLHVPELGLPGILLVGALLFYLLYMVPVLGFAVWGVVTLLGFGAVLLATIRSMRGDDIVSYTPPLAVPAVPSMGAPGISAAAFTGTPELSAPAPETSAPLASPPPVLTATDVTLLPRVGFWRRFCATLLDFVLLVMLLHLTGPFFLFLWAGYHIGMWTWRGTTIGGIILGIKIVRVDGRDIDFGIALVRALSSFFSAIALFLGFFWAGWDRERQAWHDKIAGTVVVKVPKSVSLL